MDMLLGSNDELEYAVSNFKASCKAWRNIAKRVRKRHRQGKSTISESDMMAWREIFKHHVDTMIDAALNEDSRS